MKSERDVLKEESAEIKSKLKKLMDIAPLVIAGKKLVHNNRYFTIWAPRQTGKSTYFRLLAQTLETEGYKVAYINFENYRKGSIKSFTTALTDELRKFWGKKFHNFAAFNHFSNCTFRFVNTRFPLKS